MTARDSKRGESTVERLAEELAILVDHARTLLPSTEATPAGPGHEQLQAVLRSIRSTADRLRASAAETPRADGPARLPPNTAVGVAFAAGSWPLAGWRSIPWGALGWAFSAGLLLGVLVQRPASGSGRRRR